MKGKAENMKKVIEFLTENPVFYFATVEGYRPKVRPCHYFMEYKGRFYFGIGKHRSTYKQMLANPNVELCTMSEDGRWLRVRGVAQFDNSADALAAAIEKMKGVKERYNETTGKECGLVYLDYAEAELEGDDGEIERWKLVKE